MGLMLSLELGDLARGVDGDRTGQIAGATAEVTSAIARTWVVRLTASSLTFVGQALPGADTPSTRAWPPELPFAADLAGDPGDLGGERGRAGRPWC
ncbi:hypothetical protein SRIMM317S_04375 [Streptomyces rimosus subsp. rimosus]